MENNVPPFVKKFDFRGVYGTDILDHDAYYLAKALYTTLAFKKVLVGWDTREASRNLALAFLQGLSDEQVEICYMEKVPIDYVTAGSNAFDFGLSVMFTGSHNAWDWSGLLIHQEKGVSLQGEVVEKIIDSYWEAKNETYVPDQVDLNKYKNIEIEIERVYTQKILDLIPVQEIRPTEIVVDIGDGSGSKSLTILEGLLPQVTVTRINDREKYDAVTPHTADPSEIKNMQQLIDTIKERKFAAGFAFDSDADRMLAVDEQGEYLNGSTLASALVEVFSMLGLSDQRVGYAVECGPSLYNSVTALNKTLDNKIELSAIAVGRSIVRTLVSDSKIDIGVENVGHFYMKDFFMTDSGVFSIIVLLYWMSVNGKLSKLRQLHPDGQRIQGSVKLVEVKSEWQESIINEITEKFVDREIKKIDVDGVRFEVYNNETLESWYTFRKSGYEPILKYYYGSLKKEDFINLSEAFKI